MKAVAVAIIVSLVGLLLVGIQQMRVEDLRAEKRIESQAKDEAVTDRDEIAPGFIDWVLRHGLTIELE